jgi:ribonuclease HII
LPGGVVIEGEIIGVDEVGRGSLAGPLVVGAIAIETGVVDGVRDSKLLTESTRYVLADMLIQAATAWKIIVIGEKTIDSEGLDRAWDTGVCRAIAEIRKEVDFNVVLDGNVLPTVGERVMSLVKADSCVYQVAAASIIAKVHRDRMMIAADEKYPGYSFSRNKGYGTKEHLRSLATLGPCPLHRRSFQPVRDPGMQITRAVLKEGVPYWKLRLEQLGDFDANPFANEWEKQTIRDAKYMLDNGQVPTQRDLLFVNAVLRKRAQ